MVFSGFGKGIRQINRLQKQFRYIPDFYLVSDTQFGDGLIERANAVRARRGDHPRTGPESLFDPNLSKTFFANALLPGPAAAAATTEAPLPVILHFNQGSTRYGCQDSPGRIIYGRMSAQIAGIMVGHFEVKAVDGFDGTLLNEFIQKLGRVNIGYLLQPCIIFFE